MVSVWWISDSVAHRSDKENVLITGGLKQEGMQ
jgi:hypothetical protein